MADMDMDTMDELLWLCLLNCKETENQICGYVEGAENYSSILNSVKSLGYSFFIRSSNVRSKQDEVSPIYSQSNMSPKRNAPPIDFFGFPFIIKKFIQFQCSFGPSIPKKKPAKPCNYLQQDEPPKKPRLTRRSKGSKKINCPAVMSVRSIIYFPDFTIDQPTKKLQKDRLYKQLKDALNSDNPPRFRERYYISATKQECHTHPIHPTKTACEVALKLGLGKQLKSADSQEIDNAFEMPMGDHLVENDHAYGIKMDVHENTDLAYGIKMDVHENTDLAYGIPISDLPVEPVSVNDQENIVLIFVSEGCQEGETKSLQHKIREELKKTLDATYSVTDSVVLEKMLRRQREVNSFQYETSGEQGVSSSGRKRKSKGN